MEKIENEKTEIQNLTEEIKNLTDFLKIEKEEKIKEKEEAKKEKEKQEKAIIEKEKQEENLENQDIIENQFFKDMEEKKFNFKIKEVQKWENTYIIVDNTDYYNYMWTKINEFTTFIYITIFFVFIILTFNFIKNILWK